MWMPGDIAFLNEGWVGVSYLLLGVSIIREHLFQVGFRLDPNNSSCSDIDECANIGTNQIFSKFLFFQLFFFHPYIDISRILKMKSFKSYFLQLRSVATVIV